MERRKLTRYMTTRAQISSTIKENSTFQHLVLKIRKRWILRVSDSLVTNQSSKISTRYSKNQNERRQSFAEQKVLQLIIRHFTDKALKWSWLIHRWRSSFHLFFSLLSLFIQMSLPYPSAIQWWIRQKLISQW